MSTGKEKSKRGEGREGRERIQEGKNKTPTGRGTSNQVDKSRVYQSTGKAYNHTPSLLDLSIVNHGFN